MAQLDPQHSSKIFRGTVEEVFSHRSEIPPGSTVELKVLEEPPLMEDEAGEEIGTFGGKSVLEAFPHLFGTEHGGPSDVSEHPENYMQGFGETKARRTLEL